jgi:hypothetical protein
MPESEMIFDNVEREAKLLLDAIIAHMAFNKAEDWFTRTYTHRDFVEAIKVLNDFLNSSPPGHE